MDDAVPLGLVSALIEGAFETPQWAGFLDQLRSVSHADFAILIFDPPGRPMDEGLQLVASADSAGEIVELFRSCVQRSVHRQPVVEDKVVSLDEMFYAGQAREQSAYRALIDEIGISDARMVCVSEPQGVQGWLIIAYREESDRERAEAVLSALARPLRGVLRSHVAGESLKFRSTMAGEAVRRLECGWLLLDRESYVLAADAFGEAVLARSGILSHNAGGRLSVSPAKLEREVLRTVAELADATAAKPRAISLRSDPWLDMLLVPARRKLVSDTTVPSVIAYVHGDNWHSADRCSQLCDMFRLAPSEARLALAFCRGKNIAEAASELGLALETARSYTKAIYAKTGTRGMADLVRLVMGSVLTLAPEV